MNTDLDSAGALIAKKCGRVHLMGVAGVGMAGLAAHLHWIGFEVSGCDLKENRLTAWLQTLGIEFAKGHDPRHLPQNLAALIRSTAVPCGHAEVRAARAVGAPILRRGEVLAAIVNTRRSLAICGTHGKTSTAAMLIQVLIGAGVDVGFFVGAEVDRLGGVAGRGDEIFVAEADESDGTLRGYRPDYTILTNADVDHLEHYAGEDDLWDCFGAVVANTGRKLIYNADDPRAARIAAQHCDSVGYGFGEAAAVRACDYMQGANGCSFNLFLDGRSLGGVTLPLPGLHNASNALAACAFALELGVNSDLLVRELKLYKPPRRRFERVCRLHGAEVYMDYSHHPTEIRALLQSLEDMDGRRLLAIFQPHRYTRTLALGPDFPAAFAGVDQVILAPVFPASEDPVPGGSAANLYRHFKNLSNIPTSLEESLHAAWDAAQTLLRPGDMLLLIGAGDIEDVAHWARRASGNSD